MIVKVQPSRKHSSSFKRLHEYLTQEHDADTGEVRLRGDVVMSENLLSFDKRVERKRPVFPSGIG